MGVRGLRLAVGVLVGGAVPACASSAPPPRGEALLVIDTDVTVGLTPVQPPPGVAAPPPLVDRLRVDVYALDGTWLDSREIARRSSTDFPASFSVYTEKDAASALVRIRGYLDGAVRDYQGERFRDVVTRSERNAGAAVPVPPATSGPRLLRDGVDVTPPAEPEPRLTIDRLVRVELSAGARGALPVVLHGACFGTMADLAAQTTCVDEPGVRVPVTVSPAHGDVDAPLPPRTAVTFGAGLDCTAPPRAESFVNGGSLHDDEVCVAGGAFTLGTRIRSGAGYVEHAALAGTPQRIAVIPALRVDRHEVTVGRFRAAVARGFVSPDISPLPLDGPFPTRSGEGMSAWSTKPLGREEYPLMSISWAAARAFCRFEGGDLPTEAQWEWIASAAGRPSKTTFPWGDDPPRCEGVVWGRWDNKNEFSSECFEGRFFGPTPVTAYLTDRTPSGVIGMGGGLAEWVLDSAREYSTVCWESAPLDDPRCWEPRPELRSARGGSWPERADSVNASVREAFATAKGDDDAARYGNIGFRCTRAGSER